MKSGTIRENTRGMRAGVILAAALCAGSAMAQTARVPLPLRQTVAVYDQFLAAPLSENRMDLVHVLRAPGGVIHPPQINGQPHPDNVVIFTTSIGVGVPDEMEGCFATSIIPRPATSFFVRVYNAGTVDAATFYEDSAIFAPSDTNDIAFVPMLTATTNPINPEVTVDGLSVSMKLSLGLNPDTADTDGDGVTDLEELRMGIDPTDASVFMPPIRVGMTEDGQFHADWDMPAPDTAVLNAIGLTAATPEWLDEFYAEIPFNVQMTYELLGPGWTNVMSGAIGGEGWPPVMQAPETTNTLQYFRMRLQP